MEVSAAGGLAPAAAVSPCSASGGVRSIVGNRPMVADMAWVTDEGTAEAQRRRARPGDVFIVSYPKTGTTMLQQLCHQLRTGGDTSFDEIGEVVPWFEVAPSIGQDVDLPQVAAPRCFKTHQPLSGLSHLEGARFLCVLRDPVKTLASEFRQKLARGIPAAASRDINAFARQRIWLGDAPEAEEGQPLQFGATIWQFYVEMWRCRAAPETLAIPYETLVSDLGLVLPRMAEFMGLPAPTAELRERVLELGSFQWMSSHDHLFDDNFIQRRLEELNGGGSKGFRTSAKVGLGAGAGVNLELSDETRALLDRQWRRIVTPATGFETYADMAAELRRAVLGREGVGAGHAARAASAL